MSATNARPGNWRSFLLGGILGVALPLALSGVYLWERIEESHPYFAAKSGQTVQIAPANAPTAPSPEDALAQVLPVSDNFDEAANLAPAEVLAPMKRNPRNKANRIARRKKQPLTFLVRRLRPRTPSNFSRPLRLRRRMKTSIKTKSKRPP